MNYPKNAAQPSPHKISLPLAILAAVVCVLGSALLILSPRIAYTRRATSAYEGALALWHARDHSTYTVTVVSNSRTQPTGGTNTIRVVNGQVVEAHNPECPDCPIASFVPLTVEGLFERIQTQCLRDFPTQFCNVAYDPSLGYPIRIDTSPYNRDGQERPSITVQSVQIHEGP